MKAAVRVVPDFNPKGIGRASRKGTLRKPPEPEDLPQAKRHSDYQQEDDALISADADGLGANEINGETKSVFLNPDHETE